MFANPYPGSNRPARVALELFALVVMSPILIVFAAGGFILTIVWPR